MEERQGESGLTPHSDYTPNAHNNVIVRNEAANDGSKEIAARNAAGPGGGGYGQNADETAAASNNAKEYAIGITGVARSGDESNGRNLASWKKRSEEATTNEGVRNAAVHNPYPAGVGAPALEERQGVEYCIGSRSAAYVDTNGAKENQIEKRMCPHRRDAADFDTKRGNEKEIEDNPYINC